MKLRHLFPVLMGGCLMLSSAAFAEQSGQPSPLQATLQQSSEANKFTFIVFQREQDDALRAFTQQIESGLSAHAGKATIASAHVDDPAEQALVAKYGIARAPMPMAVVVAPNGAMTGLFSRRITPEHISAALVPPTMMQCMKELQDQKLVFVCLTRNDTFEIPQGVQAVQQYPEFKDRIAIVGMRLDDPAEERFYQQMKVKSSQVIGPYAVLIAPPGALVGHFDAQHTGEQVAAAIHKAGQCCEDANCKHNHAPQATRPQAKPR